MKTLYSHFLADMILPAALLLSQCAPIGGAPQQTDTVVPVSSQRWVKVSSRPPTLYPRGVAAGCPTDCHSGEWVHTADAQDTRYFIPLHGLGGQSRQALVNEALSARSEKRLRQIAAEDRDMRNKNVSNTILYGPLVVAGVTMLAMVSQGNMPDMDRMKEEWVSSKQPH
jgi:hypothetical protein